MRPTIILIGSTPPPFHGSNIYLKNLLASSLCKEFDVIHVDTSDHRDLSNLSRLDFMNVYLALKNIADLIIQLLKHRPRVVYVMTAPSFLPYLRDSLFIVCTRLFSRADVLIHLHVGTFFRDEFYEKSPALLKAYIRWTLRLARKAIVLGKDIRRVFDGFVDDVAVVPNGSDFYPNFSAKDAQKKEITVAYLGNLFREKGVLDVLAAAHIIHRKFPFVKFRFAGAWRSDDDSVRTEAMQFIAEHHLENHVEWLGVVLGETKEHFLLSADIFCFPSWYEAFPLVILEAMAAGCPVISSRGVGAIPDVVADGETGLLVEPRSPQELAEALERLILNEELRTTMGLEGRKRFENYYTMERNAEEISKIFRELCAKS